MLRKRFFVGTVAVAVLMFAGCAMQVVQKGNNLQKGYLAPEAQGIAMIADLSVAGKKVMGQAKGNVGDRARLEKEAVLNALLQAGGNTHADVLVGARFFYEAVANGVTVTVIGYPARYKNFRAAQARSAEPAKTQPSTPTPEEE